MIEKTAPSFKGSDLKFNKEGKIVYDKKHPSLSSVLSSTVKAKRYKSLDEAFTDVKKQLVDLNNKDKDKDKVKAKK